ncbi:hypothetical protein CCACVL1_18637 [Corchorus capsularis]|uniref:ABC transmembrane type-1 domain-containing protein n=1 Tax=Corchorus capsularis TaxID=210143 RepID=A0A1R3HKB8_COCAP|nr:hypothetical protein CCACVL1_18637 [Corchorus capsularis]
MDGGKITQIGSYTELCTSGTAFEQLVNAHREAITVLGPLDNENKGQPHDIDAILFTKQNSESEISFRGLPGVQLTEEEEKESGDFGWRPFLDYLSVSKGYLLLSIGTIAQLGFVIFQAAASYWLAVSVQVPNISSGLLIGVYTGLSTLSAVFVHLRSMYSAYQGLKASKAFFHGFTNAIFKAPMHFFDSTPVGRILTRASSDMSILDFDIPFSIGFVAAEAIQNLTMFASVFLLILLPKGYVAPGLAGLSLSYALSISSIQVFMSRWYCNLSNYIISVERINQFMNIPPEPPATIDDKRPPSSWPSKGRIELQELKALEKCQLKETISSLPSKLDSSGNGSPHTNTP